MENVRLRNKRTNNEVRIEALLVDFDGFCAREARS